MQALVVCSEDNTDERSLYFPELSLNIWHKEGSQMLATFSPLEEREGAETLGTVEVDAAIVTAGVILAQAQADGNVYASSVRLLLEHVAVAEQLT